MNIKSDVMMLIIKIHNRLRQETYQMLLQQGITRSQFDVLKILNDHGPLATKELQQKMVSSQSTLPSLLQRLESQELITKEKIHTDGRFVQIKLTDKAMGIIEEALKDYDKAIDEMFNVYEKEELTTLKTLLKKVVLS